MEKIKLETIRYLIPEDCIYKNADADEYVLYLKGDQTWSEPVNLDEIYADEAKSEYCLLVLVEGSLQAAQIYNEETDGSTGLVVLGDLTADNIVVGGQEIYVTGHLKVDGLFWGDYNHGGLAVVGDITAKVFLNTDYGVDAKRFKDGDRIHIDHLLWDDVLDSDYENSDRIAGLLLPEFVIDEGEVDEEDLYSWKDWIDEVALFEALDGNKSVLREDIAAHEESGIPLFFNDREVSAENLLRFTESALMHTDEQERVLEYWSEEDTLFTRVFWMPGQPYSTMLYFQQEDNFAVMLYFAQPNAGLGAALKKETPKMAAAYRLIGEGDTEEKWLPMDVESGSPYAIFFRKQYDRLLDEFSAMNYLEEHFDTSITVEKMERMMNLPQVKELGERYYEDDFDSVLFFRGLQWQFRNENLQEEDCARISAVKTIGEDEDGNDIFEFIHFDLERDVDGQKFVWVGTQGGDGFEEEVYELEATAIEQRKLALHYFVMLEKYLLKS